MRFLCAPAHHHLEHVPVFSFIFFTSTLAKTVDVSLLVSHLFEPLHTLILVKKLFY